MAGHVDSVSWFDGQRHLRVYTTAGGKVKEEGYDGSSWYTGGLAVDGNTVGATSWVDGAGQIHIRVYIGNANGTVTEQCWDKDKWYVGAFSFPGQAASASSWVEGGQVHIRVYVRNADTATELCWDKDKWYAGAYPAQRSSS